MRKTSNLIQIWFELKYRSCSTISNWCDCSCECRVSEWRHSATTNANSWHGNLSNWYGFKLSKSFFHWIWNERAFCFHENSDALVFRKNLFVHWFGKNIKLLSDIYSRMLKFKSRIETPDKQTSNDITKLRFTIKDTQLIIWI